MLQTDANTKDREIIVILTLGSLRGFLWGFYDLYARQNGQKVCEGAELPSNCEDG